ncbi:unnamed protein product [Closterium sp. Yama58-4]|nr:unnamed protein product [Closterium sp. Yama58-4]
MLPPFASPSARALNGEGLRCSNSCGLSLLAAARPASLVPARAAPVSAAGTASARVRATAGQGSKPGGHSEGRKVSHAEGRWAEGFATEQRRGEGERWAAETQSQRQGQWRRTAGRKAGSRGSRQRVAGYADEVAAEDRLRQEPGGAVDWLMRPSNGDAGVQSARNGEWDTGRGRGNGAADWDEDGEEQGARGNAEAGGEKGAEQEGGGRRAWRGGWGTQQLQLQPLSSPSSPLAPIPSPSPLAPVPLRQPSPSPASSPRPLPSVLPLPPSALDSLVPLAGSGSQVVAFMGTPLDWLQRFVLSMGGAVLCYNVNVFATIAAAMYFLWWPLWRAAACNSALRIRYKHAGVWQACLLDVQVKQRGPLASWRLLIGDDSGTCIEMLVPIPSPPPPLRPNDPVVLLVLSDSPSLLRFRAVREAWVPRLRCWLAEEGEERVERRVLEGW